MLLDKRLLGILAIVGYCNELYTVQVEVRLIPL